VRVKFIFNEFEMPDKIEKTLFTEEKICVVVKQIENLVK